MDAPLISVVVPCYNYGRYLRETVGSLQAQTYGRWECIIVDDGSQDDTADVAKNLVAGDPRVKYIRQDNAGLPAARNRGLELAAGQFVQFLDADDLLVAGKFEIQVRLFEANPAAEIIYGDFVLLNDSTGRYYRGSMPSIRMREAHPFLDFCRRWEKEFIIPIHAFLFRRSCFESIRFNTTLPTHEDLDVHLRLSLAGKKYLAHPERVAVYRIHGTSMVRDSTGMHRGYLLALASLETDNAVFSRAVRWRYAEEVFNTLFDKLRGRRCGVRAALAGPRRWNFAGFLLLPVFAVLKFLRLVRNRLGGGTRYEELDGTELMRRDASS